MRLTARSVSVSAKSRLVLQDVCFEATTEDVVVLAGANGAGKTLLLKVLAGVVAPSSGSVAVYPVASARPGLVFQEPDAQILGRTVEEDLRIGIPKKHVGDPIVERLLDIANLKDRRGQLCHTLSGGEKRRLSIAAALGASPELLLLDEPFTYLDYLGVVAVLEELRAIHTSGCGLVIVTHDLDKVLAHATKLVLLREGQVVYSGPPEAGLDRLRDADVRRPPGEIDSMSWLSGGLSEEHGRR